jgi:hypothetical protein
MGKIKVYFATLLAIVILGVAGVAIYTVRQYVPLLGITMLVSLGVVAVSGMIYGVVLVLKAATSVSEFVIGEHGTALRGMFGKVTILAPLSSNQALTKIAKNKVVVTPVVPSIISEIENGVIAIGQLAMHMGYEVGKTGLLPTIDKWPGTFAIAGRGRSGKTRRVLTIIMQAIMGHARVFICDPHATKPDSLTNLVLAFAPWLTIARGNAEIIELSRYFLAEMENRVQGLSDDTTPWLVIYDEWSRLMGTEKIEEEDKEVMKACVLHCSTEYAGYNGFAGIIGQVWTEEAAGGTAIRRSLHKAFIHSLNAEYAKFFVKGRWANKAEDLTTRQCLYRQDGEIKLIITHTVPDDTATWFAEWLGENLPVDSLPGPKPQPNIAARLGQMELPPRAREPMMDTRFLPVGRTGQREMDRFIDEKNAFNHAETDDFTEETEVLSTNIHDEINRFSSPEVKRAEIKRLRALNCRQGEILQAIWHVKPGATQEYKTALAEYKTLVEQIVRSA